MLQWAGYGVVMAGTHPAVLECADETTAPNSQDGLALVGGKVIPAGARLPRGLGAGVRTSSRAAAYRRARLPCSIGRGVSRSLKSALSPLGRLRPS